MIRIRSKLKRLKKPISTRSRLCIASEKRHIQAHLALTELTLRILRKDNVDIQSKRNTTLDILHKYWKKGVFPMNTYKTYERTPVFIDRNGTYCAVGYLMAQTGYGQLANDIDLNNKFVLVEELDDSRVAAWLNEYGLSRKEAALIQPGYGGMMSIMREVSYSYSFQDKMLAVVSIVSSLLIIVFAIIALRLLRNRTIPKLKKRNYFLGFAVGAAFVVAGLIFYLPAPHRAIEILTSDFTVEEAVYIPDAVYYPEYWYQR